MDGRRRALLIASDEYDNPGLSRLRAPAADAQALANVLGDKDVGDFHVEVVHNEPAHVVEGRIEDLFAESQSDDLVLLHFSGHGLKSDTGELFFAVRNTRPDRLGSTAVSADFVQRCMRASRARSIVLFLDCCYGGAFGEGVAVRGAGSANVLESFPAGKLGGGRGRAVITASSAMEYAFEGSSLADEHQQQPSVFTSALVEGLTSGDADRDEDGFVSLNELYDYVYDRVRQRNPNQTPSRDVELQGDLYLARSGRRRLRALPVPADVAAALKSDNVFTRLGAVAELRARMASPDLGAALGAYETLVEVSRSDIRYVQDGASEALATVAVSPDPVELHFGSVADEDLPVTRTIRLAGPPLAGAVTVSQSDAWVTARVDPPEVHVSLQSTAPGHMSGTVTLTGPTGQAVVPVTAEVVARSPAAGEARQGRRTPASDVPVRVAALPVEQATDDVVQVAAAAGTGSAVMDGTPGVSGPAGSVPGPRQYWKPSGITALVSGAMMLLSIVLPQQWGTSTWERDGPEAAYLLYLGLVLLGLGTLALRSRWRVQGLGALVAASTIGTVVVLDMVRTLYGFGVDGLEVGFWVAFVAPFVLLASGQLALAGLRREAQVAFATLTRADWASWLVVVLAMAGALTVVPLALDTYSSQQGWGLQLLWVAVLTVSVPVAAVLARPVLLGRWALIGWCLAGATPALAAWAYLNDQGSTGSGMWFVLLTLVGMGVLAPMLHRDHHRAAAT